MASRGRWLPQEQCRAVLSSATSRPLGANAARLPAKAAPAVLAEGSQHRVSGEEMGKSFQAHLPNQGGENPEGKVPSGKGRPREPPSTFQGREVGSANTAWRAKIPKGHWQKTWARPPCPSAFPASHNRGPGLE